jgi:predicted Fe-Mo cluster-binding NifX family protein
MEKVAIPIWDKRVSPVLDTAICLLVVELDNKTEHKRETYNLPRSHIYHRVQYIANLHVDTMLCGALSRPLLRLLIESGIRVYPWITGHVQEVLEAYINGSLTNEKFALPGCQHHRRGRGRGRGYYNYGRMFQQNRGKTNREEP